MTDSAWSVQFGRAGQTWIGENNLVISGLIYTNVNDFRAILIL